MAPDAKLILKYPKRAERWEEQERGDYDIERMRQEFRERLYSKEGLENLAPEHDNPTAGPTGRQR